MKLRKKWKRENKRKGKDRNIRQGFEGKKGKKRRMIKRMKNERADQSGWVPNGVVVEVLYILSLNPSFVIFLILSRPGVSC